MNIISPHFYLLWQTHDDLTFSHTPRERGKMSAVLKISLIKHENSLGVFLFDSEKLSLKNKETSGEQEQNRILPLIQLGNK